MIRSSWDMKRDRQNFLSFCTVFLPFYSPNNPKNQNFEKNEQKLGDIIILHMCNINDNHMNAWRYYHFTHVHHKLQSYDVWFLIYQVWQTEFFVILDNFLPFYPPNSQTKKKLKKKKKTPGDIIILHKCTKNQDHMLYCSWDMASDECNCYFSFLTNFCLFTP